MSSTPPPDSSGYPSYPGPESGQPSEPYAGQSPAPEVPQPSSIRTAVRLMLVGAALSAISLVISLATLGSTKDDIRDQLREDDPNVSQSTIDAAIAAGIAVTIVAGLVGVLLWVWMAWKNGQGRSWARVVATVLAGLNVLFTLGGLAIGGTQTIPLVISLINLVLAIAILLLLWRKESSEFFAARSRPRYP